MSQLDCKRKHFSVEKETVCQCLVFTFMKKIPGTITSSQLQGNFFAHNNILISIKKVITSFARFGAICII